MTSKVKLLNIVFDAICIILVFILFLVIKVTLYGTAEGLYPVKQEFLCEDTSIQRPYKKSVVGHEIADPLSFIIPIAAILIVESYNNMTKPDEVQLEEEKESYGPISIKPWIANMISIIIVFVFGGILSIVVSDLSKISVGRLRPSFGAACKVNVSQADCQHGYVTSDVCTGDPFDIKMASLSFPSGRCSKSMYGMLFLAFYIQSAVKTDVKLLKPLFQTFFVSLSLFVGLSRVAENTHFMSDCVAGFLLGAIFAWLIAFKVLKLFAVRIGKPKVYTLLPQERQTSIKEDE